MHNRSFAPLALATIFAAGILLAQVMPVLQPASAAPSSTSRKRYRKAPAPSATFTYATVIAITDGDTLTVACNGVPEKIRLVDVDAPEKSQPFGRAAKKFLSDLAYMHEVTIQRRGHDRYGRTLATITLSDSPKSVLAANDGTTAGANEEHKQVGSPSQSRFGVELQAPAGSASQSVNAMLLAAGYAWVYRGKAEDPQFRAIEASARSARRGLWSDATAMAPWDFRKQTKQNIPTHQNDADSLIRELLHERVPSKPAAKPHP